MRNQRRELGLPNPHSRAPCSSTLVLIIPLDAEGLIKTPKRWKQPGYPRWMNKQRYRFTQWDVNMSIKGKKIVTHATGTDLEETTLSILTKSHILYDSPYLSLQSNTEKQSVWQVREEGSCRQFWFCMMTTILETVCLALLVYFIRLNCTHENGHNSITVSFPVSCICVHVGGGMTVYALACGSPGPGWGIFLCHSLPFFFETGSLVGPDTHQFVQAV